MQINKLTAKSAESLTQPGIHSDGNRLYLQVTAAGTKSWLFIYRKAGKRTEMGLGPFPMVSLGDARKTAQKMNNLLLQELDPLGERRQEESNRLAHQKATEEAQAEALRHTITFEMAATRYIDSQRAGWRNAKHGEQWTSTLTTYAYPVIGKMAVADITTADVLKVLDPIWRTKTETASRIRGRIESVLNWAKAMGYRSAENPARWKANLENILPPESKVATVRHHPAVPYTDLPDLMAKLAQRKGVGARALQFTILTACRSSEVTDATWSEINMVDKTWTIPGKRMKAGKDHVVPLSEAALNVLSRMEGQCDDLVFPSTHYGKTISDQTMRAVLRRITSPIYTVHGFRSTFRDWAAETTDHSFEVCEKALAHSIDSKVVAAYLRGDFLEKRRRLMDDWANYANSLINFSHASLTLASRQGMHIA
jgi:integrase